MRKAIMKPRTSIYRRYVPAVTPTHPGGTAAYWFVFSEGRLLVAAEPDGLEAPNETETPYGSGTPYAFGSAGSRVAVPLAAVNGDGEPELPQLRLGPGRPLYLGTFEETPCYAAQAAPNPEAPAGLEFRPLRTLYDLMEEDLFHLAGRASQLLGWDEQHRYCGRCGTPTSRSESEHARFCPSCGLVSYPRLSPAVITAVLRDGRLLLARSPQFPPGLYGLIAGFVEPGETLEDAVRREIREEVGIEVRNVAYCGSQQWPFPHSLMLGFIAEYAGGELKVDGEEIEHADWYELDRLPQIPPNVSIARKMIDWLAEAHGRASGGSPAAATPESPPSPSPERR